MKIDTTIATNGGRAARLLGYPFERNPYPEIPARVEWASECAAKRAAHFTAWLEQDAELAVTGRAL